MTTPELENKTRLFILSLYENASGETKYEAAEQALSSADDADFDNLSEEKKQEVIDDWFQRGLDEEIRSLRIT